VLRRNLQTLPIAIITMKWSEYQIENFLKKLCLVLRKNYWNQSIKTKIITLTKIHLKSVQILDESRLLSNHQFRAAHQKTR
jgi:hypothetical protein